MKMRLKSVRLCALAALCLSFSLLGADTALAASIVEAKIIGRIESIFRNRVTMSILENLEPERLASEKSDEQKADETLKEKKLENGLKTSGKKITSLSEEKGIIKFAKLEEGTWISFELPVDYEQDHKRPVKYGHFVKAELVGSVTTEYEGDSDSSELKRSPVIIWTAQTLERLKNQREYRLKMEAKNKKPPKIWTQLETVRGNIQIRKDKVYLREEGLRRKDRGLEVSGEEWVEKLGELDGHKVVVNGVTNRASLASGTIDVKNIMRIYPK
ncbi:MAG: hypothetical protein GX221_08425 [Candidatus Riflebacteria bacterium]|nr:hypothetical protein [Candidatus Riflebacteria bacterium]